MSVETTKLANGQVIRCDYPDAYVRGREAFRAGRVQCPYTPGSLRYEQWYDGWWADNELRYQVQE